MTKRNVMLYMATRKYTYNVRGRIEGRRRHSSEGRQQNWSATFPAAQVEEALPDELDTQRGEQSDDITR